MELTIDTSIIEQLSSNGVLAYIAVKIADGTEATTAALAGLVRCKTGNMLDGIKEVSVAVPELVAKVPKSTKWRCGVVKSGDGVILLNLDSATERRIAFIDDLKMKDFVTTVPLSEEQICSAKLMRDFVSACRKMSPLVEFTTKALGLKF